MPRVALFNTQFLPYSQTFVYEELRQHLRYEVEVFARKRVLAERFPFAAVHIAGPLYGATRKSPSFDRLFRTRRYALVHAHFGTGAVYALRYAHRFDLPLLVTFHGHDVTRLCSYERFLPPTWRYALLRRSLFARMTLGLCASDELRTLLIGLGVAPDKLRVHRLGIDLGALRKGVRVPERVRVIMIGRFVEKKGFEYGLRAFAHAAASHPQLSLTLVGSGALERQLRHSASSLGIAARVSFTGALPPSEVARLLQESDILLAPSVVDSRGDRESGLMVVKEASASEVVPIGTLHGGIPDIIDDGVTGYLVRERDVATLAARLLTLAGDPALREQMGHAARAKMEREYDNRACVARLEQHYDDACTLHTPRQTLAE
jgi:glycosyltransferase involved in cell wall biosynthesis